jgi:putative transposase
MKIDLIEPGYYYHIYNRGINHTKIFLDEEHYLKFLTLCKKYLPQEAEVLAYCLLPDHFHFLLYFHNYPDRISDSRTGNSAVGNLFNAYAQWFNLKTERTGGLFQRPFKRKRISDEEYLKQVIYYIHRNPMHHDLIDNPENWTYSSYRAIISTYSTMINREQVLEWFGGHANFIEYHKMQFEIDGNMFD